MKRLLFLHTRFLLIAFIGGFVVTLASMFFILKSENSDPAISNNQESKVLALTQENDTDNSVFDGKTLGILLLGYGGAGHDGGYLTDAVQVLHLDFEKSKAALVSIPRDLWVRSPSGGEMKLNNVLVSGSQDKKNLVTSGAPTLKKAVSEITGLKLDYFVGVDFVGLQRSIGLNLKGLEVEVAETLDDPWYPIKGKELELCGMSPEVITDVHQKYSGFELERQFTCRYKHLHFEKGLVKMEGEEVLEYVRSRHGSAEGDVSRGKRQQEVLKATMVKLFSLKTLEDLSNFFGEIAKNTSTDIDLFIAEYLFPTLKKARDFQIITINLSPQNVLASSKSPQGTYIMVPKEGVHKWSELKKYISSQIN